MGGTELAHFESVIAVTLSVVMAADSSSTRTVYSIIVLLGLIGVVLIGLAIWLIGQTRPEPQLFAPLERMDERVWRRMDSVDQRRDLDSLRPEGASPLKQTPLVPNVDHDFDKAVPDLASFEDLKRVNERAASAQAPSATDEDAADETGEVDAEHDEVADIDIDGDGDGDIEMDIDREVDDARATPADAVVESDEAEIGPDDPTEAAHLAGDPDFVADDDDYDDDDDDTAISIDDDVAVDEASARDAADDVDDVDDDIDVIESVDAVDEALIELEINGDVDLDVDLDVAVESLLVESEVDVDQ